MLGLLPIPSVLSCWLDNLELRAPLDLLILPEYYPSPFMHPSYGWDPYL